MITDVAHTHTQDTKKTHTHTHATHASTPHPHFAGILIDKKSNKSSDYTIARLPSAHVHRLSLQLQLVRVHKQSGAGQAKTIGKPRAILFSISLKKHHCCLHTHPPTTKCDRNQPQPSFPPTVLNFDGAPTKHPQEPPSPPRPKTPPRRHSTKVLAHLAHLGALECDGFEFERLTQACTKHNSSAFASGYLIAMPIYVP